MPTCFIYASGRSHIHTATQLQQIDDMTPIHQRSGNRQKHQQARKGHHADSEKLCLARHGAVVFPVLYDRAEIAVMIEPIVKARRSLCPASSSQ